MLRKEYSVYLITRKIKTLRDAQGQSLGINSENLMFYRFLLTQRIMVEFSLLP